MRTLLPALLLPSLLHGQVHLTARAGLVAHGAHAIDQISSDRPSFRPGTAAEWGLAAGIDRAAWRFAVQVRRAPADLVLRGSEVGVITPDALTATALAGELGRRVAGRPGAATLHVIVGVERTRWSFGGLEEPPRSSWGALVAVEGAVAVRTGIEGMTRVEGARSGSLFDDAVLPDDYHRQRADRIGVSVGIRWRP